MNNHGSLLLKNSEISKNFAYPVNATANSTINIQGNNLSNNIIFTEATASNPSVAAARAVAKAASMATSSFANEKFYQPTIDPFEKSVTFQISTMCTVQRTKSTDIVNNLNNALVLSSPFKSDTVKYSNHKMHSNDEIENVHVISKPQMNKGTKFERLRRELESLDQMKNVSLDDLNNEKICDSKSKMLSESSVHSNTSTISSHLSDQPLYDSSVPETSNCFSENSSVVNNENPINKYNFQRSIFLNSDNESTSNSSSIRRYKMSDLKRNSKLLNYNSDNMFTNNLKEYKNLSSDNKESNTFYGYRTNPVASGTTSLNVNQDLGNLMSSSSLLPETDIDSGTLSENYIFQRTDLCRDPPLSFYEKTRSLVDLRKHNDTDLQIGISKTLSIEDLKKPKADEECNLIKRLKSKAQSTQELRVADSLTKLNVPEWMNDFKLSDMKRNDLYINKSSTGITPSSFKTIKYHDKVFSKHKYNSLPITKLPFSNNDQIKHKVILPSSLIRSKSQTHLYFNPNEESKLKTIRKENSKPDIPSLHLNSLNEKLFNYKSEPKDIVSKSLLESTNNRTENLPRKLNNANQREQNQYFSSNIDDLMQQDKKDYRSIFNTNLILETTNNRPENVLPNPSILPQRESSKFLISNIDDVIRQDKKESNKSDYRSLLNKNLTSESKNNRSENVFHSPATVFQRDLGSNTAFDVDDIIRQGKKENKLEYKSPYNKTLASETTNNLPQNAFHSQSILPQKEPSQNINTYPDDIIQQDKIESKFILNTLISAVQNQSLFDEKLCESFLINPSALKLLLNVKRKTPNLKRDTSIMNSSVDETICVENPTVKDENNRKCIICNWKPCGKKILEPNKIDRYNCSCYNCFTYYCSKKCRNDDFSTHLNLCSFNRIKKMMVKLKTQFSKPQLQCLSKFAQENCRKYGKGTVLIAYESCRAADDFLNGLANRLISQPYYLLEREINNIPSFKIMNYDSNNECVITLIISAILPMTDIESSFSTFRYSFKLEYKNTIEGFVMINNTCNQNEENIFKHFETRKAFFNYVLNFFKAKNVNLSFSHSVFYNKLEKYLNEGVEFESITIFVKDPSLNSTIACTINPNKEIVTKAVRNISNRSNTSVSNTNSAINKSITETEI